MTARTANAPVPEEAPLTKTAKLRALLTSPATEFLMEAHNGLSAKIVEEAGFEGIWASGLSMSASLAVRDSNEASWTQVLDMLEFMSDATTIPILVDGDTGYGNFNNMRRAVKKLGQRGIAGICIEDKLFPKTNSFIGDGQPLADVDEFCGKIKAGKDSQLDDDFNIVARVEALISGWGMEEALRRATAYHEAGADGILIHSKQQDGLEILQFLKEWANRCPVIIVPTTYYRTPTKTFQEAGTSIVIWANHNIRAAISAMREVSRRIQRDRGLVGVEDEIASVRNIFELAGNDELAAAEKRYLPRNAAETSAVVLAASRGSALGELTEDKPKCMVDVRGQPLLRRLATTFNQARIRDITVVRGYKKSVVNLPGLRFLDNDDYANSGELGSLAVARERLRGDCLISYGDILFRHYVLDQLLATRGDIVLVADALWRERDPDPQNRVRDLVKCSEPFTPKYLSEDVVSLEAIGPALAADEVDAEWIGLAKLSAAGATRVRDELDRMADEGVLRDAGMVDLLQRLKDAGEEVRVVYITGHWLDIDNAADLSDAKRFL